MRWAETMRTSCATSSRSSTSVAWRMVSQSDWLPMITPMRGAAVEAGEGKGWSRLAYSRQIFRQCCPGSGGFPAM
ncbi:hypothetical protein RAA17_08670 [Komagataeibacter rhaeticus]|nr:hypothetical protein [Komagataeibacter rhaeticus]